MDFDPWIPIFMGFIVLASNNFLLLALPETSTVLRSDGPPPNLATNERLISASISSPLLEWIYDKKNKLVSFLRASWSTVRDRNVLLLLMVFVVATLGRFAQEILMQYVTKRYRWTWSQVCGQHHYSAFSTSRNLIGIYRRDIFSLFVESRISFFYWRYFLRQAISLPATCAWELSEKTFGLLVPAHFF